MSGTRKSNLLGKITVLLVICCCYLPAQGKYGGGIGAPNVPYLIYTAEQMNQIGLSVNWDDLDKHFLLCADIDLSGFTGKSFNIIGNDDHPFTGVFDGNGHTISNFTYTSTGTKRVGIFGLVDCADVAIKDLGLVYPDIDAGNMGYIGSLIGYLTDGTISNCYVEGGSVAGRYCVGGLVGFIWYGTLTNCYSSAGAFGGDGYIGGLVGSNFGTIINCYVTGSVVADGYSGGLAGNNNDAYGAGIVTGCYARGHVSVRDDEAGGLVGCNEGTVTNSYSMASVSGERYIGGLVGDNYTGTITNCYSVGNVNGDWDIGGLVGKNDEGTVIASFWDFQTSGQDWSDGGTGLPTAQMQMQSTFTSDGWDFINIWWIVEGSGYPRFFWEVKYGGGSGTANDPYLIYTAEQMNAIGADSNDWDKYFLLCADIDLAGFTGTSFNIIGSSRSKAFTGVFYGDNHTISNFTYDSIDAGHLGIFGFVGKFQIDGEIKNLGLIGPSVHTVTGHYVGSLVGHLIDGKITNCYVEGGSVSGDAELGGLVGDNYKGRITNCYSTCSITGNKLVGGLVGHSYEGTITNCYSTGSVTGDNRVGGLMGFSHEGRITNCYSTGSVTGTTYVGGLLGKSSGHVVTSYWDIETSGQTHSDGGIGKTTAEMQKASTFLGWACDPVWTIDNGNDYPRIWWENMLGVSITPQLYLGGGIGEPNDPYLIYTAEQLNAIGLLSCEWNKHFKLMADIDLSAFTGTCFNIIGTDWDNAFTGVFDGNGRKIFNFIYTSTGRSNIGLFGCINSPDAEVRNLWLIDPNVNAGTEYYAGSLVGYMFYGTITGCYAECVSVSGNRYVGGLVARNSRGTITNSYSTGSVSGDRHVGGLLGRDSGGTITNCYSTCIVSGDEDVGGLVGYYYRGTIGNCYSKGSVSGITRVGGLVAKNRYGTITNSYSTGSVSGITNVGGLVGYDESGEIFESFWDIDTSGQVTSAGGTGLPTAEMQMINTYTDAGWDFVGETVNGTEDIWFIPQQDYPHLWWEGMQVPMKLTPRKLNCRSQGTWVKAHLTLPQGFTVADIDPDRLAVLHSFGIESAPLYVYVNDNGLVQIEAAFERQALCSLAGYWPQELTVAGFLADGNIFLGTSKVRIIHPGMNVIEDLAWYWLNEDCVQPGWCDQIDMNRDSLVNLLDYALLMNSQVEFVTDE